MMPSVDDLIEDLFNDDKKFMALIREAVEEVREYNELSPDIRYRLESVIQNAILLRKGAA